MGRHGAVAMLWTLVLASPAVAQAPAPRAPVAGRPVRVVIASGRLVSVVDTPLHFKLVRIAFGGGSVECGGPNEMLYVLSGGVEGVLAGERRALREGTALFLPAGERAALTSAPGAPAVLLNFALVPSGELAAAPCERSASVTELYQTPKAIEGLKPGPHEFTMTRVSVDKGIPRPPMHHRSGAALYYTLAGNWMLHRQDAAAEARGRGAIQFEPFDFVHTWENSGDTTGVLLQANISPEGAPEIVFLPAR